VLPAIAVVSTYSVSLGIEVTSRKKKNSPFPQSSLLCEVIQADGANKACWR
jgi:hypothetical protein